MIFNERRRTLTGLSNKTTKKERNNKSFTVQAEQKCAKNSVGGGEWEMGEERVGDESSKRVGRGEIGGNHATTLKICNKKMAKWR